MTDDGLINELIMDDCFGILTRNGLKYKLKNIEQFNALFIDFTNIHHLNNLIGYTLVNKVIKFGFKRMLREMPHLIIGRLFSGDEIVIVTLKNDLNEVKELADKSLLLNYKYRKITGCPSLSGVENEVH